MLLSQLMALTLLPLGLFALSLCPRALAQQHISLYRQVITALVAVQFLLSAATLVEFAAGLVEAGEYRLTSVSFLMAVYLDGVSLLMLTLVSFVGWIICQFSIRYLDGEQSQGRYFCWIAFTIASVSSMVAAANLGFFFFAWLLTSWGLHQLLLHYPERPAAQRAAWTKFVVSRIGDLALLAALVIIHQQFGTLQVVDLLAAIGASANSPGTGLIQASGFLLAFGAMTKSAQFPFHTWLPLTMETPTPVSALMHAGIVNAGGYLVIRLGSLMLLSPVAMVALIVVGTITACFGAVVMMTQTSVKKKLAYSTIAQMGFMLLQCGLGAFSAAMLHIIAHSLYKAHAFLGSGSVMTHRASVHGAMHGERSLRLSSLITITAVLMLYTWLSFAAIGIDLFRKPGGIVLATLLATALTYWLSQVSLLDTPRLFWKAVVAAAGLILIYVFSFAAVDSLISSPPFGPQVSMVVVAASVSAVLAFVWLLWLHWVLASREQPDWLGRFQIHAANGFYLENWLRRWFLSLLTS